MEVYKENKKMVSSIEKELASIRAAELKLRKKSKTSSHSYKEIIEAKIPKGLNATLQTSFTKAFEIVFKHGVGIIEKSYNKNEIVANYDI